MILLKPSYCTDCALPPLTWAQAVEAVIRPDLLRFYTKRKAVTQRWPASGGCEREQFTFPCNGWPLEASGRSYSMSAAEDGFAGHFYQ